MKNELQTRKGNKNTETHQFVSCVYVMGAMEGHMRLYMMYDGKMHAGIRNAEWKNYAIQGSKRNGIYPITPHIFPCTFIRYRHRGCSSTGYKRNFSFLVPFKVHAYMRDHTVIYIYIYIYIYM